MPLCSSCFFVTTGFVFVYITNKTFFCKIYVLRLMRKMTILKVAWSRTVFPPSERCKWELSEKLNFEKHSLYYRQILRFVPGNDQQVVEEIQIFFVQCNTSHSPHALWSVCFCLVLLMIQRNLRSIKNVKTLLIIDKYSFWWKSILHFSRQVRINFLEYLNVFPGLQLFKRH